MLASSHEKIFRKFRTGFKRIQKIKTERKIKFKNFLLNMRFRNPKLLNMRSNHQK